MHPRHMMHIGFCDVFRATFNDFACPFHFVVKIVQSIIYFSAGLNVSVVLN